MSRERLDNILANLFSSSHWRLYIIDNLPGGPVTWRKSWAGKFSSALIVCGSGQRESFFQSRDENGNFSDSQPR